MAIFKHNCHDPLRLDNSSTIEVRQRSSNICVLVLSTRNKAEQEQCILTQLRAGTQHFSSWGLAVDMYLYLCAPGLVLLCSLRALLWAPEFSNAVIRVCLVVSASVSSIRVVPHILLFKPPLFVWFSLMGLRGILGLRIYRNIFIVVLSFISREK